jgi:hypothetical protein
MNIRRAIFTVTFFLLFISTHITLRAQQRFAVNLNISSLGIGGEAITNIGSNFTVRAGGNFFKLNFDGSNNDYKYNLDTKLSTVPVLIDWYPGGSDFHITGGGVMNFNRGDVIMTPIRDFEYAGRTFAPEELGNITGEMEYNKFSPYFGIGYGKHTGSKGISFAFNAGAMYQASPTVKLVVPQMLQNYPEENARVRQNIIDKMNMLRLYPVVTFSVGYGF